MDQSVLDILRQEAEHNATADAAPVVEPAAEQRATEPEMPEQVPAAPQDDEPDMPEAETPAVAAPAAYEAEDIEPEEFEPEAPSVEANLAARARANRNRMTANPDRERRLNLSIDHDDEPSEEPSLETPAAAPQRQAASVRPTRDLPDVEALNSTLRSAEDGSRKEDKRTKTGKSKPARRGNRFGFYLAILIVLILLAVYALKPQIVAALPEAEVYLDPYTDMVDQLRHRLSDGVAKLVEMVRDLLAKFL